MADKTIGELTSIYSVEPTSLFVAEQSGKAVKISGESLSNYFKGKFSEEEIRKWLDEHPEATTTVQDGSISIPKLAEDTKGLFYHPNLLDNWYFGNPVNQRGQTEHTGTQNGYFIDRWKLGSYDQTVTITNSGLHWSTATGVWCAQILENFDELIGKTFTLSAIIDGVLYSVTGTLNESSDIGMQPVGNLFVELTHAEKCFRFVTYTSPTPMVTILAAKLELGSQQTLAHQDANGNWVLNEIPDYGEQLRRCQRYFQLYSSADLRPAKAVDCRPTMRADPSQSTIVVNSTTYYYNTADL